MPQRIQRQRTKGWRMPEGAVYVGRPHRFGNPFTVGETVQISTVGAQVEYANILMTREMAVACYQDHLDFMLGKAYNPTDEHQTWLTANQAALAALRGHDLACWCPLDVPCHADVLLEAANS